ncbi:hypothetical protein Fmac_008950 [Flemingia macrophylla]|uniref:PGG domain-containing protein n=1 Tax=Flemingia macrophylla TaxID=520843 RepID=A0ABD1MYU7_9FABA
MAAASGHWRKVPSYFKINPDCLRIPLTASGITALHVAVGMDQTSFVENLVGFMNMQDMEICMADGNTAFCLAAISGNVKIAKILFDKNPKLLCIRGQNHMLPIQLAASAGHSPMTQFLFEAPDDLDNVIPFQDIVKLFFMTITNNIYTVTSKLLERYPKLVTIENEDGLTILRMLAQFSLGKETIGHQDIILSLVKGVREEEKETLNSLQLSKALFDAAKSGNTMILKCLLMYHPDLLFEVDSTMQRSLLHIAILYRQKAVYRLILSKGTSKNAMIQLVDSEGNNVLHLAGKLPQEAETFGASTNFVLMHSERGWFKDVEKIVPPAIKRMRNKDGWTPKELFYRSHKELHKESESEVKNTANTLLVVTTLIVSLGITALMTIRVDDIESTDTPFFGKKTWYALFCLSITSGAFLCAASMSFFSLIVLPSSWDPKEEPVLSRQTMLMFGNGTLSGAVTLMLLACACGSILLFDIISDYIHFFIAGLVLSLLLFLFALGYKLTSTSVRTMLSFFLEAPAK